MSIAKQHIDFVLRTQKRITYWTYYTYRLDWKTDKEIEKMVIKHWWARFHNKTTISSLYREAKELWFNMSYWYFYKYQNIYIRNNKLLPNLKIYV